MTRRNPGGTDPEGFLAQLDRRVAAVKEATREANEAIQGLREIMREAKRYKKDIEEATQKAVDERVSEAVAIGLEAFNEALGKAIDGATEKTYARFDELTALLLGETKSQRRRLGESLPEMIERTAGETP